MDWQPWLDDGYIRPCTGGGRDPAMAIVRQAWDCAVEARSAYLANDWPGADEALRRAFLVATNAFLLRRDFAPAWEYDFETTRMLSRRLFREQLIDDVYERARKLASLMPLGPVVPPETAREIRRSVAAAAEYVALVESYCYI